MTTRVAVDARRRRKRPTSGGRLARLARPRSRYRVDSSPRSPPRPRRARRRARWRRRARRLRGASRKPPSARRRTRKRNRSLVENFRRASRAAAAATTLKSERKSERAVARDRRAEITQLWAAELAFEAESDMRRATRDARETRDARLTFAKRTRGESARVRRESDRESDERETRRDENEAFRCDETRFVTTDERTETFPPTLAEARLHAAYARRECARTGPGARGATRARRTARRVRRPLGGAQKHDVRGAARSTPAGIYRRENARRVSHGVSVGTSPTT